MRTDTSDPFPRNGALKSAGRAEKSELQHFQPGSASRGERPAIRMHFPSLASPIRPGDDTRIPKNDFGLALRRIEFQTRLLVTLVPFSISLFDHVSNFPFLFRSEKTTSAPSKTFFGKRPLAPSPRRAEDPSLRLATRSEQRNNLEGSVLVFIDEIV